jgi:hypothetical protein
MGTGMGEALKGAGTRRPRGQAKESVRWQSIWWTLIEPHRGESVGLRRAMRVRMDTRSALEDNVFMRMVP